MTCARPFVAALINAGERNGAAVRIPATDCRGVVATGAADTTMCDARYLHGAPRRAVLFQFFQVGDDVYTSLRVVDLEEHLGARNEGARIRQPAVKCGFIPGQT